MECEHRIVGTFKQTWENGKGYHRVERCLDCGANVRGPGIWVPKDQCEHLEPLPEWEGVRGSNHQPSMF